jgi:Xaa-Pro aminopeptidase
MKQLTVPILLVGAPADVPDLEYGGGFRASDPVVYLQYRGRRFLVVSTLEYSRARRQSRCRVWTPELLGVPPDKRRRLSEWVLALLAREKAREVLVPAQFPLGIARRLEENGICVQICEHEIFPGRQIKRPGEIRHISRAQQAAVAAMRAATRRLSQATIDARGYLVFQKRRLTAEDIRRLIAQVLLEKDSLCRDIIVACGAQGADPHERGTGLLLANEPVVMDIFPQDMDSGYWGDLTRTVVRGRASEKVKRMFAAVKAAHRAALKSVRAGRVISEVHQAAEAVLLGHGFKTGTENGRPVGFIHSTGHGVGLVIHENPPVAASVNQKLAAGHVITIEPGLYYPDAGGMRIEDTVVVTATGYRRLAACEIRLEI